MAYNLDRLAGH